MPPATNEIIKTLAAVESAMHSGLVTLKNVTYFRPAVAYAPALEKLRGLLAELRKEALAEGSADPAVQKAEEAIDKEWEGVTGDGIEEAPKPPATVAPVTQGLTTDRDDPRLKQTRPSGQQEAYIVLSEEERAKGFVRPVRRAYRHVGLKPKNALRDLTPEEQDRYAPYGYEKYEEYPKPNPDGSSVVGRFWTNKELRGGCGVETRMGLALCETYARKPDFYGSTFCCGCGEHLPVREFIWVEDGAVVGS